MSTHPEPTPTPLPAAKTAEKPAPAPDPAAEAEKRKVTIIASIAGIIFLGFIIGAVYLLLQQSTPTDKIRDIFIIFMALESLIIGAALVVLIIQLASLINLLNNEIKPILDATNETINTLRGTTDFLSENLVEPVVKLNSYVAGLQRLVEMVGFKKK